MATGDASKAQRTGPTRYRTDVSLVVSSLTERPSGELLVEFNTLLRNILDRHAPLVTRTVTACPSALWITEMVKTTECNLRCGTSAA